MYSIWGTKENSILLEEIMKEKTVKTLCPKCGAKIQKLDGHMFYEYTYECGSSYDTGTQKFVDKCKGGDKTE